MRLPGYSVLQAIGGTRTFTSLDSQSCRLLTSSRQESVHVLPADSGDLFVRLIGPGVSLSVRGVPLLRLSLAGWRL